MLRNAFILLLVIKSQFLFSQEADTLCRFTLSGYVIDDHDRSPLSFASVHIKETGKTAISDTSGYYLIEGLCRGDYKVVCSHIGCEPIVSKVRIRSNTVLHFYPEHHEEELQAIRVSGGRIVRHETHSHESMTAKRLDETAGKNLGETLKEISGVNALQTGPSISKPVIHGLHSNRILIINHGVRQEDQQWGTEHAPDIDPFTASRLTVIKGAGAVKYGSDAIGGIVLVDPAPLPTAAELSGAVHAVGMSNGRQGALSGHLQGGAKRWNGFGWRIQGTGSISGDLSAPDYNLSNTGSRISGASASLGWKRQKMNSDFYYSFLHRNLAILRSSHIGNLTDLTNAINSGQPWYVDDFTYAVNNPQQNINHHLAKWRTQIDLNKNWKAEAQYGFQFNHRQEFDIRRGGRSTIPALDMQLQTHTMDLDFEHNRSKKMRSNLGIAGLYQRNYNVPGTGIRPLIPNYRLYSGGVYIIEKLILRKWEAEFGARYDYKSLDPFRPQVSDTLEENNFNFHNASASAGAIVRLPAGFVFRSNAGVSFRPPAANELFSEGLHQSAAAIEQGNANLRTEKGFKWVASIDYRFEDKADIRLLGYYNYIIDYIYLEPQDEFRLTIRGAFPVFDYVQTDATLAGFDFTSSIQPLNHIFLRSKISFISARDLTNNDYLINIPSNRFENAIAYQRAQWGKTEDVSFSFGILNVLEQKRVPPDSDYASPPDAYFLLNVSAGCALPLSGNQRLKFQFSIENLLDKTYREYMNRFRYYADDIGRNFIMRIHYSF